jgi:hypothetical protein
LGFQIELCCIYFGLFMTWQLFGLLGYSLKHLANLFSNCLVTLPKGRKKIVRHFLNLTASVSKCKIYDRMRKKVHRLLYKFFFTKLACLSSAVYSARA